MQIHLIEACLSTQAEEEVVADFTTKQHWKTPPAEPQHLVDKADVVCRVLSKKQTRNYKQKNAVFKSLNKNKCIKMATNAIIATTKTASLSFHLEYIQNGCRSADQIIVDAATELFVCYKLTSTKRSSDSAEMHHA